ncbi:hypothetical protein NIES2101_05300 [Calothrix sp. HK-06]|nr:hypothetical protein NIES2101_05300 [Calothrix sp. HK-06]
MVNSTTYQPPIDKLLTLGSQHLNDVAELGIGSEHIPDLIKMAVDDELLGADNQKEAMAPVHAWRILGQLQATDAIIPLIQLFKLVDNDLVNEELPKVYGKIGTAAIPALVEYLAQNQNHLLARVTAINSLEEIANQHGSASNQVKSVLTQSLQSCNQNEAELNGFIISALINLQTQEAAPVIKYAFNTNQVAEDIVGNWDEVRQSLGINSDEEVQEFHPQALEQLTNTDTNIETETSTPNVQEASEDEMNALINLVTEVTKTETQTQEDIVPTTESVSEVTETETQTEDTVLPTSELASEVSKTETEIEENTVPTTELASELADIETQTQENVVPTTEPASEVTETEIQTEDTALPTSELTSETENTFLLSNEPEVQQEIINTQENLTNTIDKAEDEIEEVASFIEVSQETQVTDEASTQVDESHEQTRDEPIEAVIVESDEESNLLEQEDNKGFGRPATSKEKPEKPQKAKPSKKKKRSFSDL